MAINRAPLSLLLLLLACILGIASSLHLSAPRVPWRHRPARSMRGRHVRAAADGGEDSKPGIDLSKLFGTNRNTPEAQAFQREWARQQMALEVPDETADGSAISDREDFVRQYIASEREKFGREIDQETAEKEVDEWLLKQATFAPSKVDSSDIAIAAAVFFASLFLGLYFAQS